MTSALLSRPGWFFDLDGTLVDSSAGVVRAFHAAQAAHAEAPADPERICARIGYPFRETVAALSSIPYAQFLPPFRREAEFSMHLDTHLLPGVPELLSALQRRGKTLALVTSKSGDGARRILDYLGIRTGFRTVIGDDDAGRTKPDPEPIRAALRATGLRPHETVMVGDTCADIEAARGAGVAVIAVGSGVEPLASLALADLQVADAHALHDLLQRS